ncbi:hypothetical protein KGM48_01065 [Patescibacteria group bacterium]|nr:hypothetical protein [Patescibacteria group bacterium]
MIDRPLQPFAPPVAVMQNLHMLNIVSGDQLKQWLFISVFVFWALYTLVAIYHWLKYAHNLFATTVSIILHLSISLALGLYLLI